MEEANDLAKEGNDLVEEGNIVVVGTDLDEETDFFDCDVKTALACRKETDLAVGGKETDFAVEREETGKPKVLEYSVEKAEDK